MRSTVILGLAATPLRVSVSSAQQKATRSCCGTSMRIVFAPNRPFVLCVMTTYLESERSGEEAISKIASAAWSTFDRLGRASEYGRVLSPK